jgi:hypothetical protein
MSANQPASCDRRPRHGCEIRCTSTLRTGKNAGQSRGRLRFIGRSFAWVAAPVVVLALAVPAYGAQFSVTPKPTWMTNGDVTSILPVGNRVYIGGDFSAVGPITGSGLPVSRSTGQPVARFPKLAASPMAAIPDDRGGYYVGGWFTTAYRRAALHLMHLQADGSVGRALPGVNGPVFAMALSHTTLYIGGSFTRVGGRARHNIAAIDVRRRAVTAWNPHANGQVDALSVSGRAVYAGGKFTQIGGAARNRVAALLTTTGAAANLNPGANAMVDAIAVWHDTLYVGGVFTSIAGQPRTGLAAVNAGSGAVEPWNPQPTAFTQDCLDCDQYPVPGSASALVVSGSTLYVGGQFAAIGRHDRESTAAFDLRTGLLRPWNARAEQHDVGVDSDVTTLAISGSTVYVGGDFPGIGGKTRAGVAALSARTGVATGWNPNPWGDVLAVAVSGSTVYVGGAFHVLGGLARPGIAALDARTGAPTFWKPKSARAQDPSALAVSGRTLYAGGQDWLAAIDARTGKTTSWDMSYGGWVQALAVSRNLLYVGGDFSSIGGADRSNIAALDLRTGQATRWNPRAWSSSSGDVLTLAIARNTVYAGGFFTHIGGRNRHGLAALDARTGAATRWNPTSNGDVLALTERGSTIYVGGNFDRIGGRKRSKIAALSARTGKATSWNPAADDNVNALNVAGGQVYAGGDFGRIGGRTRDYLAAINIATGIATPWNPNPNLGGWCRPLAVNTIATSRSSLYAGGDFTSSEAPCGGLAAFPATRSAPPSLGLG